MNYSNSDQVLKELVEMYETTDIEKFEETFVSIFSVMPLKITSEISSINRVIMEDTQKHNYVSQILLENVESLKISKSPLKIKNLMEEIKFAQLSYEKSFEEDCEEIDKIEALVIEWNFLLEINQKFFTYLYTQKYNKKIQKCFELVNQVKIVLLSNKDKLKEPLRQLYKSQKENLDFYNFVSNMKKNFTHICDGL